MEQRDTTGRAVHATRAHDASRRAHLQLVRPPAGAFHVPLPAPFDLTAAMRLTLPGLADLVLEVTEPWTWTCEGLLCLAWRCSARTAVDVDALPDDARACLADWLIRTRVLDLDGELGVGA